MSWHSKWLLPVFAAFLFGTASLLWLGRRNSPARRHQAAGDALNAAAKHQAALHEWQVAAALNPGLVEPHERLGQAYFESGALALALREFQTVAEMAPRRAHAYCRLAEASHQAGLTDLALRASRYAAQSEPRCPRARRTLSALLVDSQEYTAAMAELQALVGLNPDDAGSRLLLARVRYELGQLDEAEADARIALTREADNVAANYLVAHVLLERNDPTSYGEVRRLLKRALDLEPDHVNARVDSGRLYRLQDNLTAARLELERATLAAPRHQRALEQLGQVYALEGKEQKTLAIRRRGEILAAQTLRVLELRRALKRRPRDAALLLELGGIHSERGDYLAAVALLERAVEATGNDPQVTRKLLETRAQAAATPGAQSPHSP